MTPYDIACRRHLGSLETVRANRTTPDVRPREVSGVTQREFLRRVGYGVLVLVGVAELALTLLWS